MRTLIWILGPMAVALLMGLVVYRLDRNREPLRYTLGTCFAGMLVAVLTRLLERRLANWFGVDIESPEIAFHAQSAAFVFAISAPLREFAKIAAVLPAYKSKHFDQPYDAIVYATCSALGFSCVELLFVLYEQGPSWMWLLRGLLDLPAGVFFAGVWAYPMGVRKAPPRALLAPWGLASLMHALYTYVLFGRGESAALGVLPLLLAMLVVSSLIVFDLRRRLVFANEATSIPLLPNVPSFAVVREALRPRREVLRIRWLVLSALATLGAVILSVGVAVVLARLLRIDFAAVGESDASTLGPIVLLVLCIWSGFFVSGYLLARATGSSDILEPAFGSGIAIVVGLIGYGFADASRGAIFPVLLAPIAWFLSCSGAWFGRAL
jgi:RsiW-degrading membrane proteinase PrsW (M82 family)